MIDDMTSEPSQDLLSDDWVGTTSILSDTSLTPRRRIASPNNATDHDREWGRGGGAREKPRNNPMRCRKLNTPKSPPRRSTRDPQLNCYPPSSSSATVARDCLISSAKPRLPRWRGTA